MIKSNPVFSRGVKRHWKLSRKGNNLERVTSEQTVSKPWKSSTWLVDNRNKGPTRFYYFDLPDRVISTKKWNNCGIRLEICTSPSSMVAPRSPCGCQKITDWPTPIFGSYNLNYLLFSGIRVLLCHHPYCFSSQSQTLFVIGVGRPKVTAAARWLFRRENTFDFPGGRDGGRGWRRCFKHFFGTQIFSRLVKVFITILQPFSCFFFH